MTWSEEAPLDGERIRDLSGHGGAVYAAGRKLWVRADTGWTPISTPVPGPWRSVAVVGEDDVWVVGGGGRALHRSADGWRARGAYEGPFELVSVVAWPGGAWASAAGSEIWRWQDDAWDKWTPDAVKGRAIGPMWAAGPDDVWVAAPKKQRGAVPELLHWDGADWSTHAVDDRGGLITAVDGRASNDVWAVGYETKAFGKKALVAHWDGQSWTRLDVPVSGSVGSVHAGQQVWLLAGDGQTLVGGPNGWIQVTSERNLSSVYAPTPGPILAFAEGHRPLLGDPDEAGLP